MEFGKEEQVREADCRNDWDKGMVDWSFMSVIVLFLS
jgi:hypothetical protein